MYSGMVGIYNFGLSFLLERDMFGAHCDFERVCGCSSGLVCISNYWDFVSWGEAFVLEMVDGDAR